MREEGSEGGREGVSEGGSEGGRGKETSGNKNLTAQETLSDKKSNTLLNKQLNSSVTMTFPTTILRRYEIV